MACRISELVRVERKLFRSPMINFSEARRLVARETRRAFDTEGLEDADGYNVDATDADPAAFDALLIFVSKETGRVERVPYLQCADRLETMTPVLDPKP